MMDKSKLSILCIEDDTDTCELIEYVFKQEGCQVTSCGNRDCLKIVEDEKFSAVILDNYFDGLSGVEICLKIRERHPQTPIIFYSGEARQSEINKALVAGATDYLIKPTGFERLVEKAFSLIQRVG